MLLRKKIAIAISAAFLAACSNDTPSDTTATSGMAQAEIAAVQTEAAVTQTESEKANVLFEEMFTADVMRSPQYQTFLGIKDDYDKWDDVSDAYAQEDHEIAKANLVKINAIDPAKLDDQTAVSLRLKKQSLQDNINDYKWRHHNYPLNQMFGIHSQVPSLLINQHSIGDVKEAQDYIARLNAIPTLFAQVIDGLNIREKKGIVPPKFVFPYIIESSMNVISGAPFVEGDDGALLADFRKKVNKLEIEQAEKDALIANAISALKDSVKPGYEHLIAAVKQLATKADSRDGAWKFPDGEAFFKRALQRTTTTDLTAQEIHDIGLSEVARIHLEMRDIMKTLKFEGTLHEFFDFMRDDKQFYYDETTEGKERYLREATAIIDDMKTRLDELFIAKPKAELTVKAVEAFREKAAGKAFYQRPSMDGTRPGIYYANLYRMSDMPIYQMEALAFHEGIPGHHMQLAIAGELGELPKFRRFGRYTAYTEGWGLYSELLPKEIGYYEDPYSDFGRLAMELWRACRLVVDTGIHAMQWNREQGIEYYVSNTPNPKPDAVKMVERHIVMPSQATAYKIGMLKILELREKAKTEMGNSFDIREFHDVVLKNGPVPLNVLSEYVDEYIQSSKL
ncbi:MAG: hypothetical protein ACI8R9_002528 [Paraglaciecola sp.]